MQIFHVSKNALNSDIKPVSRKDADFGEGFYMFETKKITENFASNLDIKNPKIYELDIDITDLKTYTFNMNAEWYMYIALHHIPEKMSKYKKIIKFLKKFDHVDVLVGTITDDGLIYALDEFYDNKISEEVLLKTLYSFKCDDQYVAKTDKAAKAIQIVNEYAIDLTTREKLNLESKHKIDEVKKVIEKMKLEYNNTKSRYFDEILNEMNQ